MSLAEITLEQSGRVVGRAVLEEADLDVTVHAGGAVSSRASELALARVQAPAGSELSWRGEARRLASGEASSIPLDLRGLYGELELRLTLAPDDAETPSRYLSLRFLAEGTPETRDAYETILADLERIQPRLLHEVGSSSAVRLNHEARFVDPEVEVRRLQTWTTTLTQAVERIDRRPFEAIAARRTFRAWTPGDELAGHIEDILSAEGTRFRGGRLLAIGAVEIRELEPSLDVPEHRHIAKGVHVLQARARSLEHWCTKALDAYETDRARWGSGPGSIDEQRNGPRRQQLRTYTRSARSVSAELAALAKRSRILRGASTVVTALRPTPLWLARPEYRQAYEVLRQVEDAGGSMLVGDEFRVRLRGLDQLFEYWCFTRCVLAVAGKLGRSVEGDAFELIDDVYRPDLEPGLCLHFRMDGDSVLSVAYEPGFPRVGSRSAPPYPVGSYRSSLGTGELRPDIVLRLDRPGARPRMLILDAKNKIQFHAEDLFSASDYRTRIVDPDTGVQPARWMVYLHRDPAHALLENVPGLFAGAVGGWDNFYLAGICVLPDRAERLSQLIDRFLSCD